MTRVLVCRWDPYILDVLRAEGAEVALLFDAFEAAHFHVDESVLATLQHVFRINSFDDMDELAQIVTELRVAGWTPDRVVSLSEFSQYGAAFLAQSFGLDGPALETALLTRDKRAMKQAVRAAGVRCTDFVSLRTTDPAAGARRTAQTLGFPVVVKPAAGLGTLGTAWIHTEDALERHLRDVSDDGLDHFLMAERPVLGEELHVDAIWVEGTCRWLGVMRYRKPRIAVTTAGEGNGSALLPREEWADLYAQVEQMHTDVNRALHVRDGITHLELFVEEGTGELVFSEIASRFAGGGITPTYRAFGDDLRVAWIKTVVAPDAPAPYAAEVPQDYVGWVNLAPAEAGVIVAEPTQQDIDAFDYVVETVRPHGVGDEFSDPHPSAWCLHLIYRADSLEQFEDRGRELEQALNPLFAVESFEPGTH